MTDTDDFAFKVSRSYILFPCNKTTTTTISIESKCFNHGLMIKNVNNLPESFITDLPRNYIDNNREINITYRGTNLAEHNRPKDLFITFTDSFNPNNSYKVILEIVDAEEEFEAEVAKVEEQYEQENPFDCPICFETFTEQDFRTPIILGNCGHTLCYSCVVSLLRENEPLCPFDRKKIERDWNILTVKNYKLLLLMDHEKKKPKPKITIRKIPKFSCEETRICENPVVPCHEDRRHESTCFCTSCQLDFCHNCFLKVHPPSKTLDTHKLVSIYEKPVVLPMCRYHPRQPAALICKNTVCNMFNEKYCWQCAHEIHKHENPTDLERLMEQNKRALLQILRQLNSKKQDFSDKFMFLDEGLHEFRIAYYARKKKARTAEEIKMMSDFFWNRIGGNNELNWTEDKLDSITRIQKKIKGVLLRKTQLDDIEDLMVLAKDMCDSPVGEYELLVPQPPYEFPIEDRPDEDDESFVQQFQQEHPSPQPIVEFPIEDNPDEEELVPDRSHLASNGDGSDSDEDDESFVQQFQQEHLAPQPIVEFPDEEELVPDRSHLASNLDGSDSDEDDEAVVQQFLQEHRIQQLSRSLVRNTPPEETPSVSRPVPQQYTPTQIQRMTRDTDLDYVPSPSSSFYHGLFANVHVSEERPLRYGRKRRILVEEDD